MVRVLIVEDSPTVRALLRTALQSDPDVEVVGTATEGASAYRECLRLRPDVVTMDIWMAPVGGLQAISSIMSAVPTPILVVSGAIGDRDSALALDALRAGALDLMPKPTGESISSESGFTKDLVTTVKRLAGIKVITRRPFRPTPTIKTDLATRGLRPKRPIQVIGLAASTGGPPALEVVLSAIAAPLAVPVLVVQHIGRGFTESLRTWLEQNCGHPVCVPEEGETLHAGCVYIAPEDLHLEVHRPGVVRLNNGPPVSSVRPSATNLFASMAQTYGDRAVAAVLTGMGNDGANGLAAIASAGGYTIAQDAETSVVYGMPKAAAEAGAVIEVLPLEAIGPRLAELSRPWPLLAGTRTREDRGSR